MLIDLEEIVASCLEIILKALHTDGIYVQGGLKVFASVLAYHSRHILVDKLYIHKPLDTGRKLTLDARGEIFAYLFNLLITEYGREAFIIRLQLFPECFLVEEVETFCKRTCKTVLFCLVIYLGNKLPRVGKEAVSVIAAVGSHSDTCHIVKDCPHLAKMGHMLYLAVGHCVYSPGDNA